MKRFAVTILLVLTVFALRASSPETDSLIHAAETAPDMQKPALYIKICQKIRNSAPLLAAFYGHIADSVAFLTGQKAQQALACSYTGRSYKNAGSFDKALELYEKSLKISTELGNKEEMAHSNIDLANLYLYLDDTAKIKSHLDSVKSLSKYFDNRQLKSHYYLNLGRYYMLTDSLQKARAALDSSLQIRLDINSSWGDVRNVRRFLADLDVREGDTLRAMTSYFEILRDDGDVDKPLFSDVNNNLAQIYLNRQAYDSALYCAEAALKFAQEVGAKQTVGVVYGTLGEVYYRKKDYAEAAEIFQRQFSFTDEVFNENLDQRLVSIKFAAESEERQTELDRLAEEQRTQMIFNIVMVVILILAAWICVMFISSNGKIKKLNKELDVQRVALDENNRSLTSSIKYARRIQKSAVTPVENVSAIFPESMVFYKARDIVSGDWYMVETRRGLKILVEADCTGHGVPGSLLSMMGMSALKDILNDMDISGEALDPAVILSRMRVMVKTMLLKNSDDGFSVNDGMDMTIGIIDPATNIMKFGAANQSGILVRQGESIKLKGDRMPIGNYVRERDFTSQEIQLEKGDVVFFMSDGIKDQTNPKMEKFKGARLDKFLIENITLPLPEIGKKLGETLDAWRGESYQVDDMTMVGIRV
ncbi:MAG: SpoIIE family protein phosphatase [Bacteroidales bacterium]|nr:SpoIIE family protein phosphatase [Bacteroidales bacterium]